MKKSRLYCYRTGCAHPECRKANADYEKNRKRQIAYGRWEPYVDAEPVRQHVLWLIGEGVPVAKLLPIYPAVSVLLYGRPSRGMAPTKKMRSESAEALLAVRPTLDMLGDLARVDAAGVHRRVQALCALGWSMSKVANRMGSAVYRVRQVMSESTVTVRMHRKAIAVYDELSMVRPEGPYAVKTRRWAERQGWLPPLSWDDSLIDLPDDELAVECARQVSMWSDAECAEAYRAHLKKGDRSPLMVAGASEYRRRQRPREASRRQRAAA